MGRSGKKKAAVKNLPAARLFYATNRANILTVLSSGLVRTREGYEKYYDDCLILTPGRLPLWIGTFPSSLIPLATGGDETAFPVLVEIDPESVPAAAPCLRRELHAITVETRSRSDSDICVVPAGPLPFAAVKSLHFRNEEELRDFQSRDFDNILVLPRVQASPDLFSPGGPDAETVASALRSVPHATLDVSAYRRLDCAMGACALLSLTMPSSFSWFDALVSMLSRSPREATEQVSAPGIVRDVFTWLLADGAGAVTGSADQRLAMAAAAVLQNASPRDGWVESKVVTQIASRSIEGASDDEIREIEAWRDFTISVARGDRSAGALDDSGSIVRRALLLLVLRPQPERILRAHETSLLPGGVVASVAGFFSGLFHGYGRLSRALKSEACSPELLSKAAISWWPYDERAALARPVVASVVEAAKVDAKVAVTIDGAPLLTRVIKPSVEMARLHTQISEAGYELQFDPTSGGFSCNVMKDAEHGRYVRIEGGRRSPSNQVPIRVSLSCRLPDGRPIRQPARADALWLLERNHDADMRCRFAVDRVSGDVHVVATEHADASDFSRLGPTIDAVVRAVAECEAEWKMKSALSPKPSRKAKKDPGGLLDVDSESIPSEPAATR